MVECELGHVVDTVGIQIDELLQGLRGCAQRFLYYGLNAFGQVEFVAEVE